MRRCTYWSIPWSGIPELARARIADKTEVQILALLLYKPLELPTDLIGGIPYGQERFVVLLVDTRSALGHDPSEHHE